MQKTVQTLSITLLIASTIYAETAQAKDKKQDVTKNQTVSKRVTMPSGWSYEIIVAAPAGAKTPKFGQKVSVHYTGWLDNNGKEGKKFDSSVDRNKKFEFNLGRSEVIRGWDEAVADMKIGEKRRVYLPSNLAYGTRGAGNIIPGNAALIFDIELFDAK